MDVIIHVGTKKTGTTTLQRNLFSVHPKIHYYGVIDGYKYNYDFKESTFIFSDECLVDPQMTHQSLDVVFRDLKKTFPNSKFLLTIRDQMSGLRSLYCDSGWFNHKTFKDFLKNRDLTLYDFEKILRTALKYWKKSEILVLPLELLKTDLETYSLKISKFVEVPEIDVKGALQGKVENSAPSIWRVKAYKIYKPIRSFVPKGFAHWVRDFLHTRGKKHKIEVSAEEKEIILDRFSKGNKWVEKTFKLGLGDLGYSL